jgi:hypothetical protein
LLTQGVVNLVLEWNVRMHFAKPDRRRVHFHIQRIGDRQIAATARPADFVFPPKKQCRVSLSRYSLAVFRTYRNRIFAIIPLSS